MAKVQTDHLFCLLEALNILQGSELQLAVVCTLL